MWLIRDVGYDEKRESLIRRIDFAWAVEKDDNKRLKKRSKESSSSATTTPWQWQNMVENLQFAHQELSVIIDLINTVSYSIVASDCWLIIGCTVNYYLSIVATVLLLFSRHSLLFGNYFLETTKQPIPGSQWFQLILAVDQKP